MSDVHFTPSGPPETVLPEPDPALITSLGAATDIDELSAIAASHPADPLAWAALGDAARETGERDITTYAYYRVGYHRGLDLLRKHGWKGSGHVRWTHRSNQGFLRCLQGLADMADAIGEEGEGDRCRHFLIQLDPEGA